MKLYTEEQVREIIERAELNRHMYYEDVLEGISPIELPSDENVYLQARRYEGYNEYMDVLQSEKASSRYHGFIRGVDWMRDKIQEGNSGKKP